MTPTLVSLPQLALAAALVLANAALSLGVDAALARTLVVAAARTVVQLLLVGVILKTVFASAWLVVPVIVVMLAVAGAEIRGRQSHRLRGRWRYGLGAGTMLFSTFVVGGLALAAMRPASPFDPRVVIPLIGLLLGSVMNGVSLGLETFTASVVREAASIEARLALGATRTEALQDIRRKALRSGTTPVVNQMSAAGIITLPGMMSGQILAGMPPLEAAKAQVLVLLLLSAGAVLGTLATLHLATHRVTDERHRLRLDRLADD